MTNEPHVHQRRVPIGPVPVGFAVIPIQTAVGASVMLKYELSIGDVHLFMDVKSATKHAKDILDACRQAGSGILTPPTELLVPKNGQ